MPGYPFLLDKLTGFTRFSHFCTDRGSTDLHPKRLRIWVTSNPEVVTFIKRGRYEQKYQNLLQRTALKKCRRYLAGRIEMVGAPDATRGPYFGHSCYSVSETKNSLNDLEKFVGNTEHLLAVVK